MPHIDTLKICLFRGFHDIFLENLGRINVIVGANNCGKSSVLEALYILCRPMDYSRWRWLPELRHDRECFHLGSLEGECIDWFFPQRKDDLVNELLLKVESQVFPFRELCVKKEELLKEYIEPKERYKKIGNIKFDQNEPMTIRAVGVQKRYSLMDIIKHQEDQDEISLNFVEKRKLLAPSMRGVPDASEISESELAEQGRIKKTKPITNYCVSVSHIKTPKKLVRNIMPIGANDESYFVEDENYCSDIDYPHVLVQPEAIWSEYRLKPSRLIAHIDVVNGRKTVVQLLKEFDSGINDFKAMGEVVDSPICLEHTDFAKRVPLDCFGNGLKRAFILIASAAASRDGILLIDEIETGLHYSAMKRTMKALILAAQAFNVQVFLTTHSLEAIDAFLDAARENNSLDEVVGFSLNNDKTKQPKRLDGHMMQRLRFERGFEVR